MWCRECDGGDRDTGVNHVPGVPLRRASPVQDDVSAPWSLRVSNQPPAAATTTPNARSARPRKSLALSSHFSYAARPEETDKAHDGDTTPIGWPRSRIHHRGGAATAAPARRLRPAA